MRFVTFFLILAGVPVFGASVEFRNYSGAPIEITDGTLHYRLPAGAAFSGITSASKNWAASLAEGEEWMVVNGGQLNWLQGDRAVCLVGTNETVGGLSFEVKQFYSAWQVWLLGVSCGVPAFMWMWFRRVANAGCEVSTVDVT